MNNAFEFTFMLESYPSQHPPSPLSFFTPSPTPSTFLSPSLLPLSIFTIHPHQSSASFLLPPPHLSSALLTLHLPPSFHQTADRKRCRIRLALPPPNTCCISVYYPGYCSGGCSPMHLHIHGFRIGTLARFVLLFFWHKLSERIRFAGLSEKIQ